jgi:alpha-L-rhamnosidase
MAPPNNNCDTYAVTLCDSRQMLISNHSGNRECKSSGYRSPLNVALSQDGKS